MDTPFFRSTSTSPEWVNVIPQKVNIILTLNDLYNDNPAANLNIDIVRGCWLWNFSVFFKNSDSDIWYDLFDGKPEVTTQKMFKMDFWAVEDGTTKTLSWDIPPTVSQMINPNGVKYKVTGLIPIIENSLRWHIHGIGGVSSGGTPEEVSDYKNFTYGGSPDILITNYYYLCNSLSGSEVIKLLGNSRSLDSYKYSLIEVYGNTYNYEDGTVENALSYSCEEEIGSNIADFFNLGLNAFPFMADTSVFNKNAWANITYNPDNEKYLSRSYSYIVNNANTIGSPALNIILSLNGKKEVEQKD